jgi:hypothetical protein
MQVKCPFLYLYNNLYNEWRLAAKPAHVYTTVDSLYWLPSSFSICAKVISSVNPQTCQGPILPFLKVL